MCRRGDRVSAITGAALAADAALIAAAKKEGQVVWYTTQIVDQFARPPPPRPSRSSIPASV
jgi:hypothetical protein